MKKYYFISILAIILSVLLGCSNSTLLDVELSGADEDSVYIDQSASSAPAWPILKNGSKNRNVFALQYLLKNKGYSLTVDGNFGPGTESIVKSFQSANGLTVDGIVGANTWSKLVVTIKEGSSNNAVKALQNLLQCKYDVADCIIDGKFGAGTKLDVISFQKSCGISADGIVGSTSWQYLIGNSGSASSQFWDARRSWYHPLKGGHTVDPATYPRYFGASRDGGTRAHGGTDYIAPVGTYIVAMTSGTVIGYYSFYVGVYALVVKNDDGSIIRYGEIKKLSTISVGSRVAKGQNIAVMTPNTAGGSYMLHLEVFAGTTSGGLTQTNYYYKYVKKSSYADSYVRRSDLISPMSVRDLPIKY